MKLKRNASKQITDHHIIPKTRGGQTKPQNIKHVQRNYHEAFHTVFHNMTPEEIHAYLDEVWFSPLMPFIKPYDWLQRQN